MNRLLLLIVIVLFSSCSKSTEENKTTGNLILTYEIDTVIIDSGDDFLFLKYDALTTGASHDKKLFYNVDELGSQLEIIDLDSLILKEKIPLDRDGPNSIGPEHVSGFQALDNGNLCFYNIRQITVLSTDFQKVSKLHLYPEAFEGDTLPEKAQFAPFIDKLKSDGSLYAGLYIMFFENEILGIVLIDVKSGLLKLIPTDKLDFLKDLVYITKEGNATIGHGESKYVDFFNNNLIINTSAKNEVLIYDIYEDSIITKSYNSNFTSDFKKGSYMSEKNSDLSLKLKDLEVYFGSLVFDELNGVFWRYSRESKSKNPEKPTFEYVVTVFDKDLNQLHEEKLNVDWSHIPSIKFVKDGMLYTYINLDDEMAFVRLKPKLSKK